MFFLLEIPRLRANKITGLPGDPPIFRGVFRGITIPTQTLATAQAPNSLDHRYPIERLSSSGIAALRDP